MNSPRSAWFIYIVLRLLFFVVPFSVLMLLGIWPWLSAVFAALIGVSLSVILLAKPRATASESIYAWRNRDRTADDVIEDDAVDTTENSALAAESDQTEPDPEPESGQTEPEPESGQTEPDPDPEHQDEQSPRS